MRNLQITILTSKPITEIGKRYANESKSKSVYEHLIYRVPDNLHLNDTLNFIRNLDGFIKIHSFSQINHEGLTPDICYEPLQN